jgi:hypothetical protein
VEDEMTPTARQFYVSATQNLPKQSNGVPLKDFQHWVAFLGTGTRIAERVLHWMRHWVDHPDADPTTRFAVDSVRVFDHYQFSGRFERYLVLLAMEIDPNLRNYYDLRTLAGEDGEPAEEQLGFEAAGFTIPTQPGWDVESVDVTYSRTGIIPDFPEICVDCINHRCDKH